MEDRQNSSSVIFGDLLSEQQRETLERLERDEKTESPSSECLLKHQRGTKLAKLFQVMYKWVFLGIGECCLFRFFCCLCIRPL